MGALVTMPGRGSAGPTEATVVAIKQNIWPKEWKYIVRVDEKKKDSHFRSTIVDRGSHNLQDTTTRIILKAIEVADGATAFFFNAHERLIRVTIIEQGELGFYTTVRSQGFLWPEPHVVMKLQSIETHRLFTANMNPHDYDTVMSDTERDPNTVEFMNWGPETPWNLTTDTIANQDCTAINPSPPYSVMAVTKKGQLHGPIPTGQDTALAEAWAAAAKAQVTQDIPAEVLLSCVIPKRKRLRKGPVTLTVLIKWRSHTIPCHLWDSLTPATLFADIENSDWAEKGSLTKAVVTTPSHLSGALLLEVPLIAQGIKPGDNLTMLVRHATVYDPHDGQHHVAYRAEDRLRLFLEILQETLLTPTLSDWVILHEGRLMDPNHTFHESNLPHEPTLQVRLLHDQQSTQLIRSENPKGAEDPHTGAPTQDTHNTYPTNNPQVPQSLPHDKAHTSITKVTHKNALLRTPGANLREGLYRSATQRQIATSLEPGASRGRRPANTGSPEAGCNPPNRRCWTKEEGTVPQNTQTPGQHRPSEAAPLPAERSSQALVQDPWRKTYALIF